MALPIGTARRDPRERTKVGAYLTDEKRLVRVLEVDHSGAIGENVLTDELVEITSIDLMQRWRPITPSAEP